MKSNWLPPACAMLLTIASATISGAQSPTIDGQLDAAFYGAPLAVQDTPTSFGNATNGHVRFAKQGSELDAAYARVSDGYLFLFFAGNVETAGQGIMWPSGNMNKLDIFVDSIPGGQGGSQGGLRGDNAEVDGGALGNMGHLDETNDGLKFDTGFDADFYMTFYNSTLVVPYYDPPQIEVWRGSLFYATLPSGGNGTAQTLGIAQDPTHQSFTTTFTFTNGVKLGFNNSNTGGVWGTGDTNASDTSLAASVTTGLELAIPIHFFADTNGALNSEIRITAFINDSAHRSLSNQVLGPMSQPSDGYGNLNDPRLLNFSADYSPGNQYFSVANPYPSARALLPPVPGPDNTATNCWLGTVGHSYVLQAATNLVSPVWSNVSGTVTAVVPTLSVVVTNVPDTCFYRSRQLD